MIFAAMGVEEWGTALVKICSQDVAYLYFKCLEMPLNYVNELESWETQPAFRNAYTSSPK